MRYNDGERQVFSVQPNGLTNITARLLMEILLSKSQEELDKFNETYAAPDVRSYQSILSTLPRILSILDSVVISLNGKSGLDSDDRQFVPLNRNAVGISGRQWQCTENAMRGIAANNGMYAVSEFLDVIGDYTKGSPERNAFDRQLTIDEVCLIKCIASALQLISIK